MSFHVGQKVVCVGIPNESGKEAPASARLPEFKTVYTIRTINVWRKYTLITLVEVDNSHLCAVMGCRMEPGFDIRGFRPVVERKTDISIFTSMLTPKQLERVER